MFGAFAMRFLLKSVFFYAFGTCVSPRRIFLRLGHLRLVQVYLFYACVEMCVEIGLARLLRVYFLTRTLCLFLESAFLDCTCGNKNQIFAASVFWQHMFS